MRLQFGDCLFDTNARTLERSGGEVRLSGKAFQLLEILIEERPEVVAKEELFRRIWPDTFVSDANLATLVKEVRAATGDDARSPHLIRTAHRVGYAFTAPVQELPPEPRSIDSVAVLPFTNLTGDAGLDYLSDGLAESLINALSTATSVRVVPRGTSFRYRGREEEVDTLRAELNARALVTGRLRIRDGGLNVQIDVTDLPRSAQIWGGQFTDDASNIHRLEEALARELFSALRLHLSGDGERRLRKRYASDAETYQLYLRGRHHWNRRTLEGIERGIFYFQAAIERDPRFAPAYCGLADSYVALASRDLLPPVELFPKAEALAARAIELDPDLSEAHASCGAIHEVFRWNWRDSEASYREALRLNPSYVTARTWYALALAHQGRISEALAQMNIAIESDPLSFTINTQFGVVQYLGREYEDAATHFIKALDINPHYEAAHFMLGLVREQQGRHDDAEAELGKSQAISRGEPHAEAALGHLAAIRGETAVATRHAERLRELAQSRHVSPVHFATVEIGTGDRDAAFASLERAVQSRSGWLVYLKTEPRFDPLRDDPRFAPLLRSVGL